MKFHVHSSSDGNMYTWYLLALTDVGCRFRVQTGALSAAAIQAAGMALVHQSASTPANRDSIAKEGTCSCTEFAATCRSLSISFDFSS
eukprot:COSAG05_NODE_2855_length_2569_cov_10.045352_3_plen_88_part_00